ncbi:MAG: hypothetical protein S4CHLAM6_09370 [Chlamydiae bacterium]|nr:hypothetical protein [Chlamydiota bacterium]
MINPLSNIVSNLKDFCIEKPTSCPDFEKHLLANDDLKTRELIDQQPELVNAPITSGYLPIEIALLKKNIPLVQSFLTHGAYLNHSVESRPSPLDQLILQDDEENLNATLGNILSQIVSVTHANTKKTTPLAFTTSLELASTQLLELSQEVSKFQSRTKPQESSPLFELISSNQYENLHQHLSQLEDVHAPSIFNAICYAVHTHNNMAVEVFYEVFGDEILKLQTTDLKNLYHIAAIADNAQLIHKLSSWGLKITSNASNDELGIYSPFHYAIMHPSLDTFIALTKTELKYPKSVPLELFEFAKQTSKAAKIKFNPTQLLVLKAYLNNPIPKSSLATKLYLSFELMLWAAQVAKPYLGITKEQEKALDFCSNTLTIVRMLSFFSVICDEVKGTLAEKILKTAGIFFYYGSVYSIINNTLQPVMRAAYKPFQIASTVLVVKKVFNDFTRYQKSYFFRPLATLQSAIKDQFINAIFVKNAYTDYKVFLDKTKENRGWASYFNGMYQSSKKAPLNHNKHFELFSSPSGKCPKQFTQSAMSLNSTFDRIPLISEETYLCCFKNVKRLSSESFFKKLTRYKDLSQTLVDCLASPGYSLTNNELKRVFRRLNLRLYPDKCGQEQSSLSNKFCTTFTKDFFNDFVQWFK